ncbi:hypothetical protein VP1G_01864 [Cytospora mali]|uniref:Uncharacterized protein n=1 Tax=Cytospora mali TaxID=578113 RepID=A0A194US80_CYTMA|nr:hypothetical protein VP1G_01864 [Valsa mali var. pyri (nom. inval.)]
MAEGTRPSIHLRLIPSTDNNGDIGGLRTRATLKGVSFQPGDVLFSFGRQFIPRNHPSWYLYNSPSNVLSRVSDRRGPLVLTRVHENSHEIRLDQETEGDVIAEWEVSVVKNDFDDPDDLSRLHRDQGGVIGAGRSFLPHFNIGREYQCQAVIEWDLSGWPEPTRAVCSFGEGPEPVTAQRSGDTLLDCVFMVGVINSHPPEPPPRDSGDNRFCSTYWFGDLPPNLSAIKDYPTNIFPRMAEHFKDEQGSYRTFFCRAPKGPKLTSTSFHNSSIVEYDDDHAKDEHDWDLVRLLNRAMVTAWARIDAEDDGSENDWFTDGLSLLYTVYLPFRFGQRSPDYFRVTINAFLSAYYTNPLIRMPYAELNALVSSPKANHCWYSASAMAMRAFVYMLKMDFHTRRAAVARSVDVMRPMDEIVRDLLVRRRHGGADEKVQKRDWLAGVAYWLGQENAERHFREMIENDEGRVNEMDDLLTSFGQKHGPHPVEQEMLEFGFDRKSLEEGHVSGSVEGSRAWETGLKNGDRIVWYARPESCEMDIEKTFKLTVERDGEKIDIVYWPRSRGKVRCWQVLEGKYVPPTS